MNLVDKIREAGVVGAGGAGFPTHVKLHAQAEIFIINAAECEPLIETDKYLCRSFPEEIVQAAVGIQKALGAKRLVIALKRKYQAEIEALQRAAKALGVAVEFCQMESFYPAGDEQVMVEAVTGRVVSERNIPLSVGAVVDNVGTVLSVYEAMHDRPVTEKHLSVTGNVPRAEMLKAPIGTAVRDCLRALGVEPPYDLIVGGPMMGKLYTDDAQIDGLTVTKTTGNLLVLPKGHLLSQRAQLPVSGMMRRAQSVCLQCRMCTEQCPRYRLGHSIEPHKIMRAVFCEAQVQEPATYERLFGQAVNCSECGLCESYSCPMGLSPRRVNQFLKGRLRTLGISVPKKESAGKREAGLYGRAETERLTARLGLAPYAKHAGNDCKDIFPHEVRISFSQHIGAVAVPVCREGDWIEKGALLADIPEGALGAKIHASVSGKLLHIDEKGALIVCAPAEQKIAAQRAAAKMQGTEAKGEGLS